MSGNSPVIDADGHFIEPADTWEQYIDPSFREQAIRIEVADDGRVHLHADLWDVRALSEAQVFGTGSWRQLDLCLVGSNGPQV